MPIPPRVTEHPPSSLSHPAGHTEASHTVPLCFPFHGTEELNSCFSEKLLCPEEQTTPVFLKQKASGEESALLPPFEQRFSIRSQLVVERARDIVCRHFWSSQVITTEVVSGTGI